VIVTPGAAGVTASTHDGNVPANVVDNNLGTRWSAGGDGQWIQLALPGQVWLRSVSVAVYRGNERKNRFDILSSNDGTTWTSLLTNVQSSGTTTAQETYTLPYQLASRLRYRGHGHVTNAGATSTMNSVTEIDVVATTNQPTGPPPTPTGVQAYPDAGRVTLRWMHSGGGSYRVFRSADQCDTFLFVGTASASFDQSVTFTDTNVLDGRRYYYAVSAVNSAGESARTAPIAATPQLQRPAAPILNGTTGPVDSGRIDLVWTMPSLSSVPTRYTVRRALRPSCYPVGFPSWTDLATVDAPTQSYADTTAQLDVRYLYTIVASNAAGAGPASNVLTATAPSSQPPSTPTPRPCPTATATPTPPPVTGTPLPPNPVSIESASGRLRVTWTRTGAVGERAFTYSVYRADTACGPFQQIARFLGDTSYTDSGLVDGSTYYYVAVGVNPHGESLDSDVVGAAAGAGAPKAPTGLTASAQPGPTVRLTWNEVLADTYTIKRSTFSGGPYATITSGIPAGSGTTRTWDDTTVAAGTVYYYVVAAVTSSEGPHSNEAQVVTPGAMPPPFLTASPASGAIALAWTSIPGATGYRVRSAPAGCSSFSEIATVTGTTYNFTTSSPTRRYFQIVAVGNGTESSPSNTAASSAYVVTAMPPTVTATPGDGRMTVSWSAVGGATMYRILRGRQELFCSVPVAPIYQLLATTTATSHVDLAVHPSSTYFYQVAAVVPGGETQPGSASARVPGVLLGPTPTPMGCPMPTPTPTSTPTPTPAPGVIPGAPANMNTAATHQKATLTWDHGPGNIGYSVYRGTTACGPYQVLARDVPRPPYVDSGLANGTSYVYVVTGRNRNGEGPQSEERIASPLNGPPDALDVVIGEPSRPYARFRWKATYGAADYVVRKATSAAGPFSMVGSTAADLFIDRTGPPGVSHVYQVTARNAFGESAPRTLTATSLDAPTAPTGLTATAAGSAITLQWTASAGASQYKVYRHTSTDGYFAPMATVSGTTYSDQAGLTSGVRYYYVVTALSAAESEVSNVASAVAPQTDVEITPPSSQVTASTNDGNVPGNTVDGSLATRWAGYGGGAWIRYDLGTTRTVTRVKVAVYRGDTRQNYFYIQQSPDNSNWYTVWSGSSSGTTTALETIDIPNTSTRYIRYYGQGNINSTGADTAWNSVTEVEIFAVP
jgi:fibronectin type 3 domain-containing protein